MPESAADTHIRAQEKLCDECGGIAQHDFTYDDFIECAKNHERGTMSNPYIDSKDYNTFQVGQNATVSDLFNIGYGALWTQTWKAPEDWETVDTGDNDGDGDDDDDDEEDDDNDDEDDDSSYRVEGDGTEETKDSASEIFDDPNKCPTCDTNCFIFLACKHKKCFNCAIDQRIKGESLMCIDCESDLLGEINDEEEDFVE